MKKIIFTVLFILVLVAGILLYKNINRYKIDNIENESLKYIGEYLDTDVNDIDLIIEKNTDDTYSIKIGIYRLTWLDDGVGKLTKDGMTFTATDAAGNPISGIITVDDNIAVVKFTDSTWTYIQNGDEFKYQKK